MSPIDRRHWPEYLIEGSGIAVFMMSACAFGTLLEHPDLPIRHAVGDPFARRVVMGIAMGLTAMAIVYSPWGRRSGAHVNPSVTLTFLRLGKIHPADAAGYTAAQFVGGAIGVAASARLLGPPLAHPAVDYVVTMPGPAGIAVAFAAEATISFVLMTVILWVSNSERLARSTGVFCGVLVGLYIALEAPISGMSMNPARSLASALAAGEWRALWIYFTAPPLGMLAAAEVYLRLFGDEGVFCAKLHHVDDGPCIFCAYRTRRALETSVPVAASNQANERGRLGCHRTTITT
jgi:aquaporin Z